MENKPLIITLLIVGIIGLAIGYLGGILSQGEKIAAPVASTEEILRKASNLIKIMSSEMIPSLVAIGKIANISGKTITLKAHNSKEGGLTIPIEITENTQFASFTFPSKENGKDAPITPIREEIEFKDIKVGNDVNINFKIMPDNTFQGVSVIVFPPIPIID